MKRNLLLCLLIFLTGCSAQYNLNITGNTYMEEVILTGSSSEENNALNRKWQIAYDKNIYNIGDEDTKTDEVYDYKYNGNMLTFSHQFSSNNYSDSTAASICFNKVTVNNYIDEIIISTSPKAECFNKYPNLTNITAKITTDKKVLSNNADSVSGNTYIWNLTKGNASNKAINMVLEDSGNRNPDSASSRKQKQKSDSKFTEKYAMYIFCSILLIVFLVAYAIYKKITKEDASID